MSYDFPVGALGLPSIPGYKNYDCGEFEMSVLDTDPAILHKQQVLNLRGFPSVEIERVRINYITEGNVSELIIPGPFLAELDSDWSSFGNIIGHHLDILFSSRNLELLFSPTPLTAVDAVLIRFQVEAQVSPNQIIKITGDIPCLGRWLPTHGLTLTETVNNVWRGQGWLPKNTSFQWKFVKYNHVTQTVIWEGHTPSDNRTGFASQGGEFLCYWMD